MRIRYHLLASALLTGVASPALAQFAGGSQEGGQFAQTILQMPITPRAVALGEAMSVINADPSTIWYNAAGLAGLRTNAFTVNAKEGFAQTQLVGAAVAFPTQIGSFGVAARAFNGGTIQSTLNGTPNGGEQREYQLALEGGGALQLSSHWYWGGTLAYSQETLAQQTQGAVSINSGMQFPDIFGRVTLAGGVRNLGTNVRFDQAENVSELPLHGYFGAGWDVFKRRNLMQTPLLFKGEPIIFDAKLVGEFDFSDRERPFAGFGAEGTVNGVLVGRLGYQTGQDNRRGVSLGAGVNVGQFRLEYAFRNYRNGGASFFTNDPAGDSHNVGFTYFWGGRETNTPVVPVIVQQPVDTAAINAAVRNAMQQQMQALRPLLDSLRQSNVQISSNDMTAKYVVPVHFGFDSAMVRDSDLAVLGQIADVIRRVYPNALVTIEGFADPAGSPQYNLDLSRRRADAVKQVMVQRYNLPAQQFKTVGYGKQPSREVTPGASGSAAGAELNRRVTFTIDATQHF